MPEPEDARGAIAVRSRLVVFPSHVFVIKTFTVTATADAERLVPLSGGAGAVQRRRIRDCFGSLREGNELARNRT